MEKPTNVAGNWESDTVLEEDLVSLDDILTSAPQYAETQHVKEKLLGSYVCKLFYVESPMEYLVTHPNEENQLIPISKSTIDVSPAHDGSEVLIVFDGGEIEKPVVTGIVRNVIKAYEINSSPIEIQQDQKESLIFEAGKEIVLKCGKSSITLTKAGKVLIRGAYLLSRSSGVNQIKGGSVHLN